MRRRRVEEEVVLLHVLAVVTLGPREAEQALLQNRVVPVPQGQGEAEAAVVVGDAADPVLAPAVRARPGVVVREVLPGGAVRAVVLAHRAPFARGQVGAPAPPVGAPLPGLLEPCLLGCDATSPGHGALAEALRHV